MSVAWTVQGDTEDETRAELQRMCERLGLVPTLAPCRPAGQRWIARAQAARPVNGGDIPA